MREETSLRFPLWVKLLWVAASAGLAYRLAVAAGWF